MACLKGGCVACIVTGKGPGGVALLGQLVDVFTAYIPVTGLLARRVRARASRNVSVECLLNGVLCR